MPKINDRKIRKNNLFSFGQLIVGLVIAMVLTVVSFTEISVDNFRASSIFDTVDDVIDAVDDVDDLVKDVEDMFDDDEGGGTNKAPGCSGSNCMTVPATDAYHGISTEGSFRQSLITWTNFFLGFLAIVAMIMIIFSGFTYVTAAGNNEQIEKAKKILTYAVIGIIVILIAFSLVNTLIETGPTGSDLEGNILKINRH